MQFNNAQNDANHNSSSKNGRALEVKALYEGTPQTVQHYRSTRGGRITWLTGVLLACGLLLSVGGAAAFGSQLYSVKRQEVQRAKVREFVQEKGLPQHFVPGVRTNRTAELGGALAFAGGLFMLLLGGFRAREERRVVAFTIGEDPRADYATPTDGLPNAKFPLVAARDHGFVMRFTNAMEGTVSVPGTEALSLYDLAHTGVARPAATQGVFEYSVPDGASCRIQMGANTFLVSSVDAGDDPDKEAAGALIAASARRPIALTTAGSAAVMLAFLMLFQLKPAEAGAMEADSVSRFENRGIRSMLKQARKEREPEHKDEAKKPPQDTKRPKANRNSKAGTNDDRRMNRKRSGNQGNGSNKARTNARNQGSNVGVVSVLKNMRHKMSNMIAYHNTMMAEAEDALVALQPGTVGGDGWLPTSRTPGPGGPAVVGPPGNCKGPNCKGNPWTSNTPWTVSTTVAIPGPPNYNPKEPVVEPGHVKVPEGIDGDTIRRYIRMKKSQFRYCYVSNAMVTNPRAAGTVKVAFMISKKGIVLNVKISFSSLNDRATEQCVARTIKRIKFPKTGGRTAFVTYPLRFRAAGRR